MEVLYLALHTLKDLQEGLIPDLGLHSTEITFNTEGPSFK